MPKLFYRNLKTGRRTIEQVWQIQLLLGGVFLLQIFVGFYKHFDVHHLIPCVYVLLPLLAFAIRGRWTRRLRFYKEGLIATARFPFVPEKLTFDKIAWSWSDLDSIRFQRAGGMSEFAIVSSGRGDSLIFDWKSAKTTTIHVLRSTNYINLDKISQKEREGLFLALSKLVPQEVLSPEVLYLQVQSLSGSPTIDLQDYTKVWLEEYTRRFELSNYINPRTRHRMRWRSIHDHYDHSGKSQQFHIFSTEQ